MGMKLSSMDAQTKRGTPGFTPLGAACVDEVVTADAQDTQAPGTQSPASLTNAMDAKQNNASTNDGGKTQTPITGWVNSGKVVTTFDGKEGCGVDFGDATANSPSVVAIKP